MYERRPVKSIEIFPETEWLCENPVYYRQNDDAWKSDRMGTAAEDSVLSELRVDGELRDEGRGR